MSNFDCESTLVQMLCYLKLESNFQDEFSGVQISKADRQRLKLKNASTKGIGIVGMLENSISFKSS